MANLPIIDPDDDLGGPILALEDDTGSDDPILDAVFMGTLPIIDLDDDDGGTGGSFFGGIGRGPNGECINYREEHEALIAHLSPEEQEKVRKGFRPFRLPLEPIWKP